MVHDDLRRWAFTQLFPDISDQIDCCKRWLQRCDRDSRIKLLQYLIELRSPEAEHLLASFVFEQVHRELEEVWQQIANILSEPLFAARYRRSFVIALIRFLLKEDKDLLAENAFTAKFGLFCAVACNADKDELLGLINEVAEGVAALRDNRLQEAMQALVDKNEWVESWLKNAETHGFDFSTNSRQIHNYIPPRIEIRVGSQLQAHVPKELINAWHTQISSDFGLPLPSFSLVFGETTSNEQAPGQDFVLGHEVELRLDGRRVAAGEFYPDQYQTLRRHWDLNERTVPLNCTKSYNEAMHECVVWTTREVLDQNHWSKQRWDFEEALKDWVHTLLRRHLEKVFAEDNLTQFIDELSSISDRRLNMPELLRSISGNYLALGRVLVNLTQEFVPLSTRRVDLMIELQKLLEQNERINLAFLVQKLREHVRVDLCKQFSDETNQLGLVLLDPALEEQLRAKLRIIGDEVRSILDVTPDQALKLAAVIKGKFEEILRNEDAVPVLVCEDNLRLPIFRLIRYFDPRIYVLSYPELSSEVHLTSKGIVPGFPLIVKNA